MRDLEGVEHAQASSFGAKSLQHLGEACRQLRRHAKARRHARSPAGRWLQRRVAGRGRGVRVRPAQSHPGPVARGLWPAGFVGWPEVGLGPSDAALAAKYHLPPAARVGQIRHRIRQKGAASSRASRAP